MNIIIRQALLICLCAIAHVVSAQPTANFTANTTTGCAPLLVQFTSTSTGNPSTYQWNFNNGATSVLQNPSTTFTTPGTYTVTLTVSNGNGSHTETKTSFITVHSSPAVNFTADDTSGCPPHPVVFTDASNPQAPGTANYSWSFGDGNTSTIQHPNHSFQNPGYYNVTLIVTNSNGCKGSLTKNNYVHALTPPIPDFTAPNTSFCSAPATVAFTANVTGSGPYVYNWNFGDGGTATGSNPSHTYNTGGSFTVRLIVTDSKGCKDTVTKQSFINTGSINANFTAVPASACVNTAVSFNNTSTGTSRASWIFGDGSNSSEFHPSHVYQTAGTYNVRLIAGNGACSDTVIIPVTILPKPSSNFTTSPTQACPAPTTMQFNNTTSGSNTYSWAFGDGGTSSQNNPQHVFNVSKEYEVLLISTGANGCKDSFSKKVRVNDLIIDGGAAPLTGCVPLRVNFSSHLYTTVPNPGQPYPHGVATYKWDFGDVQCCSTKLCL